MVRDTWAVDLDFLDLANLTPLVVAARRARLVGSLELVALRALPKRHGLQLVVRTPLRRSGLRMSAFGVWHRYVLSAGVWVSDHPSAVRARSCCFAHPEVRF